MKKIISILCILSLMFCFTVTAFADNENPEQNNQDETWQNPEDNEQNGEPSDKPEEGQDKNPEDKPSLIPVATGYTAHFENVKKVIQTGEFLDISTASISFQFSDGTTKTVTLDNSLIGSQPDSSTVGYKKVSFELYNLYIEIPVFVIDESVRLHKFSDLKTSFWGYEDIRRCIGSGILVGISENKFSPLGNMTRAEFCQMLYNIYKDDSVLNPKTQVTFSDIKESDWYYQAVTACANAGIIVGYEGKFDPKGVITRQDAAIMMMNIIYGDEYISSLDFESTVASAREQGFASTDIETASDYAKNSMAAAVGIIYSGDDKGNLYPAKEITRAECSSMMSQYFFKGYEAPKKPHIVYLSPSNQIDNKYKGVDTTEGIEMQKVAEFTKQYLEAMGYEVVVSDIETPLRDTNLYGEPYLEDGVTTRAEQAAAIGAKVYVAIHSNAAGRTNSGKYQGTTCFYNGQNEGAKELSQAILDSMSALTPTKDNPIKDDVYESLKNGQTPYAEVWRPTMANLILEVEYHDYKPYAQWIVDNVQAIGQAIAVGIDNYFKSEI